MQELTDFTESCQAELRDLFDSLEWSQELDTHAVQMEVCPFDPNHTVPRDRMEKHKAACQLSHLGYSKEEQAEMFDPSVYYEKANVPSITMDVDTFHQVILQTRENAPNVSSTGIHTQSKCLDSQLLSLDRDLVISALIRITSNMAHLKLCVTE